MVSSSVKDQISVLDVEILVVVLDSVLVLVGFWVSLTVEETTIGSLDEVKKEVLVDGFVKAATTDHNASCVQDLATWFSSAIIGLISPVKGLQTRHLRLITQ